MAPLEIDGYAPLEVLAVVFGSESWVEGEANAIFQRPREDLL